MNLQPNNNRLDDYDDLWDTDMKTLMECSMEDNREHRKFGYLHDMCSNSPSQLGSLTSESFSKTMISAANLLVCTHRTRLDHDNIDKIFLCTNKWLMKKHGVKRLSTVLCFIMFL